MIQGDIVKKLAAIVGKENLRTDKEDLIIYSYDATPLTGMPDVIVSPANAEEVAAVIKLANEKLIPVVPRGGGTNLSGGSLATSGGIVLSMMRLNQILEIDEDNLTATLQPGVITADFHAAVEALGLMYPPDPQSALMSSMGGNVAENAGGPRGVKYGVTKDYILGLKVVMPNGDHVNVGGKRVKNVSGYDLIRLFTGSEGTLCVITEITVRLIPKPEAKKTMLALFNSLDDAASAVSGIIRQRIIPTTIELMDKDTMTLIEAFKPVGFPTDAEGALLLEVDGVAADVERQADNVIEVCKACGASEVKVAQTPEEAAKLWVGRKSSFGAIAGKAFTVLAEDATVPRSKVPDIVRRIQEIAKKHNVRMPTIGHAGDGNMHPNIMCDGRNAEEMKRVDAAIDELFRAALDLGGTLSGEHGIGHSKQKYMQWEFGEEGLAVMRSIKKALDPNNILNPGKIL